MYKIIIIYLTCTIVIVNSELDNILKYYDRKLSNTDEYFSNKKMMNDDTQYVRIKKSFEYPIPIKLDPQNLDNKIIDKIRHNRGIKHCKSSLCTTTNIPLTKKFKDKTLKGEKSREPYVGSSSFKETRQRQKQKDSNEKISDYKFAESLESNFPTNSNEINQSNKKIREKSSKLVCYCRNEDCQDCQSNMKLIQNKSKRDKYRETISNNNKLSKIPLNLSKFYDQIPLKLNTNNDNYEKMQILPIIHGIPSHVYPLTVPFRVTYEQVESPIEMIDPISQQYQQNFINNQCKIIKQHIIASKKPIEMNDKSNTLILKEDKNDNDISTTMNYLDHETSDLNLKKEIDENSFDANMLKCIELYGRKVCHLAAATVCKFFNKNNINEVGSIRNYYDTSTSNIESNKYDTNNDHYDFTKSNTMIENALDDSLISTDLSITNYSKDYYDFTTPDIISITSNYDRNYNYLTSNKDSLVIETTTNENYYDYDITKRTITNSNEISFIPTTFNIEKSDQSSTNFNSILIDSNFTNNIEYTTAITIDTNHDDPEVINQNRNLIDPILGESKNPKIMNPELDYSNIEEIINNYVTSENYDEFKEISTNKNSLVNYNHFFENSTTNTITTNIPDTTNDRTNLQDTLSTKTYTNLIENPISIDSTVRNTLSNHETITENNNNGLRKEYTINYNQKDENNDTENKTTLKYNINDFYSFTSTEESIKIDLFSDYIESNDYPTDISNQIISPNVITSPIESSKFDEESTINVLTVSDTFSTINELKLQTHNQRYLTSTEKLTTNEIAIENDETINEKEFVELSNNFDTTLNPIKIFKNRTNIDNEVNIIENPLKINEIESTTHRLTFYDNKQLINSIKTIINNFNSNDDSKDLKNMSEEVELSPEIVGIPRLKSLLSLTSIENLIINKVKDHLSTNFGIPRNTLHGEGPSNAIKETFRNTINLLPNVQSKLPPMTVEEHQFRSGHWTTNLVTLLPLKSNEQRQNHEVSERLYDHIKNFINNPVIGLKSVKQNRALQNIIIQATKHRMENDENTKIDENIIRDILGNVLQETTNNYETTTEIVISDKDDDNRLEIFKSTTDYLFAQSYSEEFKTDKELTTTDLNEIQTNDYSNTIPNGYYSSTEFNKDNQNTVREFISIFETTSKRNVGNTNEEILEISKKVEQSDESSSNKAETNESEVLKLPQNSFVGVGNPRIVETTLTNEVKSNENKEKCHLCKIKDYTDKSEIVTNFNKKIETTIDRNNSKEINQIISKPNNNDITNNMDKKINQNDVNVINYNDSTINTNFNHLKSNSENDSINKNDISKNKINDIDKKFSDLLDLQNSEIYYMGDNVKFPLEIKKLNDGSYVLLISKKICENVLEKNCPCYVPIEGNIRLIKRSITKSNNNNNNDYVINNKNNLISVDKSKIIKSMLSKQRILRSTILNQNLNDSDENDVEILMIPVLNFAKKYNLRLNLDDYVEENDNFNRLKRIDKIDKNVRSKTQLIEQSNEIIEEDDNVKELEDDDKDEYEERKRNNTVFQRLKFLKKRQKNFQPFRQQRAIKQKSNRGIDVLKSLTNWFRKLFVE